MGEENRRPMNEAAIPLSPKETKVLTLFAQGRTYKEICVLVGRPQRPMKLGTLKTHCRRILLKTYTAANLRHAAWLRRQELNGHQR
jgi:DNA-binding NarL/FixJ family response regulator